MANQWEIPWAPPSILPGAKFLTDVLAGNAQEQRSRDYLEFEKLASAQRNARESAQAVRDKERFDADQKEREWQHQIQMTQALPQLFRFAVQSPQLGNVMGAPYGVSFSEHFPAHDLFKAASNANGPMEPAGVDAVTGGEPGRVEDTAAPAVPGEPKKKLRAKIGEQSFDVPEMNQSTGLGPEADALYTRLLQEPGIKPADAFKLVVQDVEKKQGQQAIADRVTAGINARSDMADRYRLTAGQQEQLRRDQMAQSEKNARIGAAGRVAASQPQEKINTANRQDIGALRSAFSEWKKTVNLSIDSKSHKRLATAMANLDSGNAMQQREAAESLVSIFKGGGQVTKASQDLLLHNLAGIVGNAETFIEHLKTGKYGERELNVLKEATRNALSHEDEQLGAYEESARDTFGPGSGFEHLGGNVNTLLRGAFKQFGRDIPDVYQGAESVSLGSGERPKKNAAPAAPVAHPSEDPVGTIRDTPRGKMRKVGPNNWQPVTP